VSLHAEESLESISSVSSMMSGGRRGVPMIYIYDKCVANVLLMRC
jgi:hypothetical protein